MPEQISTDAAPTFDDQGIPISQAIVHGNTVYVAGQVGVDPGTGEMVEGGAAEQTRQVFENLSAILQAAGSSLEQILKTTVFITDMGDFATMNEVYVEYVTQPYPARSAIGVKELAGDFVVEIEAIAALE